MTPSRVLSHIIAFSQLTRVFMSVTLGFAAVAGARLGGVQDLPVLTASLLLMIGFTTAAGGFALNDLQDLDRDQGNNVKPLVRATLSRNAAGWSSVVLFLLSLCLSLILGPKWFAISCGQILVLLIYSKIKRLNGAYGNIVTALLCASGLLYGAILGKPSTQFFVVLSASFLLVLGREVLKDVLDVDQDRSCRLSTIPSLWGVVVASRIAAALAILGLVIGSIGLRTFTVPSVANATFCAFLVTGVVLCWNASVYTRSSLSWALHVTAAAMLLTVVASSLSA